MAVRRVEKVHHYWYTFNLILEAGKSCIVIDGGNYNAGKGELIILTPKFPRRENKSQIKNYFQEYWAIREEEKQRATRRNQQNKIRIDILFEVVKAFNFQIPESELGISMLKKFLSEHSSFSPKNLERYFENKGGKNFHILIGQPIKIENGIEIEWDLSPTATSNVKSTPKSFHGIDITDLTLEKVELQDQVNISSTINQFEEILNILKDDSGENTDTISHALSDDEYEDPYISDLLRILKIKKQVIIYGPPGSGKTRLAKIVAKKLTQDDGKVKFIQMHPNYSYVNFIEGLLPVIDDKGNLNYVFKDGVMKETVNLAKSSSSPYCFIIDEINRGNLQKVIGEAFYCLEYRGQDNSIQLSSGNEFYIPENLYLIGTMNSADRSVADIDFALRRRFGFIEIKSDHGVILDHFNKIGLENHKYLDAIIGLFQHINKNINEMLHGEGKSIGHSYFLIKDLEDESILDMVFFAILPLLEDYFYQDKIEINSVMGYDFIRGDVEIRKISRDELNIDDFLGRFEGE